MNTKLVLIGFLLSWTVQAREPRFYEKGILTEMNGVDCGYEENGAKGVTGVLLGTDSEHRKIKDMVCQEYVLRSDRLVYKIRPKEEKHPRLLPVGEEAEFRNVKDHMYVRVPELDDKERQYLVTSILPRTDLKTSQTADASKTLK